MKKKLDKGPGVRGGGLVCTPEIDRAIILFITSVMSGFKCLEGVKRRDV